MAEPTESDRPTPTPWIEWGPPVDQTKGLWDIVVIHTGIDSDLVHNGAGTVMFTLATAEHPSEICNEQLPWAYVRCVAVPGHDGPHLMCSEDIWIREPLMITQQVRRQCPVCHPKPTE